MAAKGKYREWLTDEGLTLISCWARDGLTNEDIAHNIGINVKTLYEWQSRFSEFSNALKNGKEIADYNVENALYKRAMGYRYKEITKEPIKNTDTGEIELQITKEITKEVAPDVTAQIYWLKNRRPEKWRERKEAGIDVDNDNETGVVMMPEVSKATEEN